MPFIDLILLLIAIPATLSCAYLALLTMLSAQPPPPERSLRCLRFDVLVPAHNESAGIVRTIDNLKTLDWPQDRYRLIVIADNCDDDTAERARSAGAVVIERTDSSLRGKGHALAFAFARSIEQSWADAVVVVDADSVASANLLEACAARIEAGAAAVQVHYGTLNPDASWRTRLLSIALAAIHILRSRARERLKLSCGIRGNGWCVTRSTLASVPYAAYSLTEDVEFGIDLGLAGRRVHYADEAQVLGEMVASEKASRSQRQRWESGRLQLLRARGLPLLWQGLRRLSPMCIDLALDLLVLPLSLIVVNAVLLSVLGGAATWIFASSISWPILGLACLAGVALYVLRGWQLSGTGLRGLMDLGRAPWFVLWKLILMARNRTTQHWVRTEREQT
ncbi:MAG: glycosyltransferase [Gammaproteobacteria bacterium]|nr:glycosyltransferase [Gammaproteobacteria bacterium]